MKKLLILVLILTMAAMILTSCNSGVDKGTSTDSITDSSADSEPTVDESIEYDESDIVSAALAQSNDKSLGALLEALGDKYTLVSEHLVNWNYELRQGYLSNEAIKKMIDDWHQLSSFSLPRLLDIDNYKQSSPCIKTVITVNGIPYTIYSTVKEYDELGLFCEWQTITVDEATLNTVFRIVKGCGETITGYYFQTALEETGSAVYHDTDFKLLYDVTETKE